MYRQAKFMLEMEFSYSDELDYCETLKDIIERARELASAEIVGEVTRTVVNEDA